MKILTITIAFAAGIALLAGCKKNTMETYNEKTAVYFPDFTDKDSVVFSFAGSVKDFDTVFLTINLLGDKLDREKKFKLEVNPSLTTALEGLHFEKLKETYLFPAGKFSMRVPIILYKTDPLLAKQFLSLGVTIRPTDELEAGYPIRLNARIVFTSQLVKPAIWDNFYTIYYGVYSKVKHEMCIRYQGHDFPGAIMVAVAAPYGVSYWMSYGRAVCTYFTDNIVYDENGNRIMPWAAF